MGTCSLPLPGAGQGPIRPPGGPRGGGPFESLTPWDLEGVDWDSVGRAMKEIPIATGLDFMELTLDTEDWYRIGETLSCGRGQGVAGAACSGARTGACSAATSARSIWKRLKAWPG